MLPSPLAQSQSTLTATHQLYQLALNDASMHLKLRWETFLFSVFYNSVTGLGIHQENIDFTYGHLSVLIVA